MCSLRSPFPSCVSIVLLGLSPISVCISLIMLELILVFLSLTFHWLFVSLSLFLSELAF